MTSRSQWSGRNSHRDRDPIPSDELSTIGTPASKQDSAATAGVFAQDIVIAAAIGGTSGNDLRNGTSAADTINGLAGNDTLNGLGGNDTLNGGSGNDKMDGGSGADSMVGDTGNDSYVVDNSGDKVVESSAPEADAVTSSVAPDG